MEECICRRTISATHLIMCSSFVQRKTLRNRPWYTGGLVEVGCNAQSHTRWWSCGHSMHSFNAAVCRRLEAIWGTQKAHRSLLQVAIEIVAPAAWRALKSTNQAWKKQIGEANVAFSMRHRNVAGRVVGSDVIKSFSLQTAEVQIQGSR